MDSIGSVLKALADLIVMIWEIHFTVFGYEVSIGSIFLFCALVGLVMKIIGSLTD